MARKPVGLVALILGFLAHDAAFSSALEYAIDPDETVVSFAVKRFGLTRQSGEFSSVAGMVALDAEAGQGAIDIAVDTRSVSADSAMMESFLRGPAILNVERYSEIAYKAQTVVFKDGKPERIDGHLTLLGVTRRVSLTVERYSCGRVEVNGAQRCELDATATFKRSGFGMNHYLAVVSDEVKLAIHGVARVSQD